MQTGRAPNREPVCAVIFIAKELSSRLIHKPIRCGRLLSGSTSRFCTSLVILFENALGRHR